MSVQAGMIVGIIIPVVVAFIFIIILFKKSLKIIKEREVMIIERFGSFHTILHAGVHWILPFIDRPKTFYYSYYVDTPAGKELRESLNLTRISTQNEVIDLPKQNVITRDNASLFLDAVLSYKIINPKQMIYSCVNLPNILSKLLQAQLRNLAGTLEIDQIIEESHLLNALTGLMNSEASKYGAEIGFVKIQRVEAMSLNQVLAQKKNTELQNKEIIITAKAHKQTKVIQSEGQRDSMIKKAEGEAQEIISKAKGLAQAKINGALAEVRSIKEISRAVGISKDSKLDVAKYILTIKYLDALKFIMGLPQTSTNLLSEETVDLQSLPLFGVQSVAIPASSQFIR
ncbi:hypothetical protein DICPUDRAFT_147869 [Dictyostelium purpureum]|uniref:Band 7 domain-containing protein n=1 Tax=Dictyostelium purpureum TaxID=5786 RepID=F0Z9M3_DICPU|nr:uncharacterized protein DICPUDRAFT_147869 [Dictyostelium purpureum]EGC39349.1 hypothetical protein DICPUDRAFT_147869 [Dictyostelium purpureum]|eukprot:XP_003284137.1 hypothetical protein DICPUDRAFT_147869 [Dictyostelium purpureum]